MDGRCDYHIREFNQERDIDAVHECFVSAFHHVAWPLIEHAEPRLVKEIIEMFVRIGDVAIMAEAEGEARGILVGYFPLKADNLFSGVSSLMSFLWKFHTGRYDMRPLARVTLNRIIIRFAKFLFRHPLSPSETIFLASQEEYRGGIGRVMMDAWVAETRSRGYLCTTVCTDSALSWDFYERYGFERVKEFPQTAYAYSLPGEDVTAYIYSLDL